MQTLARGLIRAARSAPIDGSPELPKAKYLAPGSRPDFYAATHAAVAKLASFSDLTRSEICDDVTR